MVIEFFDGLDQIAVERHNVLRNLERCEQSGSGAVVGQGPPERWCHPVGMKGAKRVTLTRTERCDEIVQPHSPVVVIE